MENHKFLLQFKCRVCNVNLDGKSCHPLQKWAPTIQTVFSYDIASDNKFIHPVKVCGNCRSTLNRLQNALDNGKETSTSLKLSHFTRHDEHCSMCFPVDKQQLDKLHPGPSATKKKKQSGGPGRGKRAVVQVLMPQTSVENIETTSETVDVSPNQMLLDIFGQLDGDGRHEAMKNLISCLTVKEKSDVAHQLGQSQRDLIDIEIEKLRGTYKNIAELKNFDVVNYVSNANPVIRSFVDGACNVNSESISQYNVFISACIIDAFYKLRVPSIITPFSFMRNLALFVSEDRKWATKFNAATCPGGSYTLITEWMKDQTAKSRPVAPHGDILNVFDNDQVIGKSYMVKPNNRLNMSIVTNRTWIVLDQDGRMQEMDEFIPGKWMVESEYLNQAVHSMVIGEHDEFKRYKQIHMETQTAFLHRALLEVQSEQAFVNGVFQDEIDKKVEDAKISRSFIQCLHCDDLVPKRRRKCPGCGVDLADAKKQATDTAHLTSTRCTRKSAQALSRPVNVEERYKHMPSNHHDGPTKVIVADPVFCNPNSYESLTSVLRQIGVDAGIYRYGGKKRHWTVVCCDGLPYHLCLKLIDEMLTCTRCQSTFFGITSLQKHHNTSHADSGNDPTYYREFDWVVLRIGSGHYEMNMIKSFTELNWKVFMSDLCTELSFRSPAAQQSAKRCDSHHKAWAVLLSFFLGSMKELVLDYVRDSLNNDQPVTPMGYMQFAKTKRNIPNFTFLHDQVFIYALAILNFRMGIRRNNSNHVESAKHMFKSIFFGRHHPIYAQIEVHDTLQHFLLPEPVRQQLSRHASFSSSGDKSKGQDADFLLEEINKETKSWLSRGVPDDSTWQTICRNLDDFKEIKSKVHDMSCTSASSEGMYRNINVDANVDAWRCRLRETGYLRGCSESHTGITGVPLHHDLINFRRLAEAKRSDRLSSRFFGGAENASDVHPVFIDAEEASHFNSIEQKKVSEIKKMIEDGIRQLISSEDDQNYIRSKYSKTKKKIDLISLYHEIQTLHSNQVLEIESESELD